MRRTYQHLLFLFWVLAIFDRPKPQNLRLPRVVGGILDHQSKFYQLVHLCHRENTKPLDYPVGNCNIVQTTLK